MTDHSQHHIEWEKAEIYTNSLNSGARQRFLPSLTQNSTGSLRAKSKKKQERASIFFFKKKKKKSNNTFSQTTGFYRENFRLHKIKFSKNVGYKISSFEVRGYSSVAEWLPCLHEVHDYENCSYCEGNKITYSQLLEQISKNKFGKRNG